MKRLTATAGTKSKLAKPVQELIKTIFDVESMKKAMVEFEVRLRGCVSSHFGLYYQNVLVSNECTYMLELLDYGNIHNHNYFGSY